MTGKELHDKDLLTKLFSEFMTKTGKHPSVKLLDAIDYIEHVEMDVLLTKEEYEGVKQKTKEMIQGLEEEELRLTAKLSEIIYKNLEKELWKAYIEKKAREMIK